MLHLTLKEKTKLEHASLEKKFMSIIDEIKDRNDYTRLLLKIYAYYSNIERVLKGHLMGSLVDDYQDRLKCHHLIKDIDEMRRGIRIDLPVCSIVPDVRSFHSALGVLYVIEGSTLGGQIIARIIGSKLQSSEGLNFFSSYGNNTTAMWTRFREFLSEPYTEEEQQEIIGSAMATFVTFKNWLGHHE